MYFNIDTSKILAMTQSQITQYTLSCEEAYNSQICAVSDEIIASGTRAVMLAGPSCSGKTTGSYLIKEYFKNLGKRVFIISLDDFFKNVSEAEKNEHGVPNYDTFDHLELELLLQTAKKAIAGGECRLPVFDFKTGTRHDDRLYHDFGKDDAIIFEGLHSLNTKITSELSGECYKIFTSVHRPYHLDGRPLFSAREVRLIRRIVRDKNHRNRTASATFLFWDSVISQERENILKFMPTADFIFSSGFEYEPCMIKKDAVALLGSIRDDDEHYPTAKSLCERFLPVPEIDKKYLPQSSLLREFIY